MSNVDHLIVNTNWNWEQTIFSHQREEKKKILKGEEQKKHRIKENINKVENTGCVDGGNRPTSKYKLVVSKYKVNRVW